jgi:hypothetical protein
MTIGLFAIRQARAYGISDDQELEELRLQQRFQAAVAEMRKTIEDVNSSSVLVEIEPSSFDDFLSDECPDARYWSEKLEAARRG